MAISNLPSYRPSVATFKGNNQANRLEAETVAPKKSYIDPFAVGVGIAGGAIAAIGLAKPSFSGFTILDFRSLVKSETLGKCLHVVGNGLAWAGVCSLGTAVANYFSKDKS